MEGLEAVSILLGTCGLQSLNIDEASGRKMKGRVLNY